MMKLVTPSVQYQSSYTDYIKELGDEERYPFPLDFQYHDFEALLNTLENFRLGKSLPDGFVPSTTLWLVKGDELIGVTNLRHCLNEKIRHCGGHIGLSIRPSYRGKKLGNLLMKLSTKALREKDVKDIHIHCFKSNIASAKIISQNGGLLDSEIVENCEIVQRFIVEIPKLS